MMRGRCVLTLALAKPLYVEMASTLARSFFRWNGGRGMEFRLVTDQPERVASDVSDRMTVVPVAPGELGVGFTPKLHLDRLAESDAVLFVDADSICYGPLDEAFARFAGRPVAVIGESRADGEFFGDIAARCARFAVASVPCFVGGVYYLERGSTARSVFAMARELEREYDALKLHRLRGCANEEPLVSIAMAVHGLAAVPDDGSIKAEPMSYRSGVSVDVLTGRAILRNTPGTPAYNPSVALTEARPRLVHYNGHFGEQHPYTTESARLRRVMRDGWPEWAARAYSVARHAAPEVAVAGVKAALRPAYRRIWGVRPVATSARL